MRRDPFARQPAVKPATGQPDPLIAHLHAMLAELQQLRADAEKARA